MKLLGVKPVHHRPHQVSDGVAPIVLSRPAHEIPRRIVHLGTDFTNPPRSSHRNREHELPDPASNPQGPAKPGHQLLAL
jgi:hypothetical protein